MQFHWPSLDATRKLSTEEAAELAARVADLTKAGLPLGEGLRALAQELSSRRLNGVLRALADRLDVRWASIWPKRSMRSGVKFRRTCAA